MPETAPAPAFAFPHPEATPQDRHEAAAALDRDAAALPKRGPIADLVLTLGAELTRLIRSGADSRQAEPFLRRFGEEAFRLTGSVRGMRAVSWKAANLDRRRGPARRDLIDKAWHGVGDDRAAWAA